MSDRFYSPRDVADLVGLSEKTIWKAIRDGDLDAHRFGRRLRISNGNLESWLEKNAV